MSDNKPPIEIKDSTQTIVGSQVSGDVNQTVNYYLSENKFIKDLISKIKGVDEKLNKEGIDVDFKNHLLQQKNELQEEYNKHYKAIERAYHDVLKFRFTNNELKELQQLFLEGKHQEIEDKVKPKAIAENLKIREEANKIDANKLLILAKSKAIQFEDKNRLEKTIEYFELSLKANRNEENLFYYAIFLQRHKQSDKAISLYEDALDIIEKLYEAKPKAFVPHLLSVLNNLGALQIDDLENALEKYMKIWSLVDQLDLINNPNIYETVVLALINFSNLLKCNNKYDDAEKSYQEAISLCKELARDNPETHLQNLALALNNYGSLLYEQKKFEKAKESYEEALGIRIKLCEIYPQTNLPKLAENYNNLAKLLSDLTNDKREYSKAKYFCEEAIKIFKYLSIKNPNEYSTVIKDLSIQLYEIKFAEGIFK